MRPLNHVSRTDLESLLRARQLDRTLTTALPPIDPHDEYAIGPSGVARLDRALDGGFPRGQLSEIVGARSSGRASLLIRLLAAATARGELVALIDALDMFDVESGEAAGVDLGRLLWIRGHVTAHPGASGLSTLNKDQIPERGARMARRDDRAYREYSREEQRRQPGCPARKMVLDQREQATSRDHNQRAMEQAIRALTLVLGAGNFGLVVFDAGEAPADAFRRLPFTTWLRLQRMIEGRQTIGVLVGSEPLARSSAGLTVMLCRAQGSGLKAQGAGIRFDSQLFDGLDVEAHVIRARARVREDTRVAFTTAVAAETLSLKP